MNGPGIARVCLSAVLLLLAAAAAAQTREELARCRQIEDESVRVRCYDALVPLPAEPASPPPLPRDDPRTALVPSGSAGDGRSLLSQRWELDREDKYGTFKFTFYRPNYILPVLWSDDANVAPASPTRGPLPLDIPYQDVEAAFQLSFKIKMVEEVFGTPSDIWIGYTQQSFWQVYNEDLSRPFRETNYEPEAMWVIPTDYEVLGLRGRLLSFGLVHQSNGRAEPLSRSWDRVYAMTGLERGPLVLQAKVWSRLNEDAVDDDNPDIADYIGRAELLGFYQWPRGSTTALRLRTTFKREPSWGSAQFDWRFPISNNLKGYLQVFTGHGESMIDYNFRKTSIGIGISIGNWY